MNRKSICPLNWFLCGHYFLLNLLCSSLKATSKKYKFEFPTTIAKGDLWLIKMQTLHKRFIHSTASVHLWNSNTFAKISPPICMYFLCREKQVKILSPISHQSITPTQELLSTHTLHLLQLCELYQQLYYRPVESDNDWYCAPGDPRALHCRSSWDTPWIARRYSSSILIETIVKKANIAFKYWSEKELCKDL